MAPGSGRRRWGRVARACLALTVAASSGCADETSPPPDGGVGGPRDAGVDAAPPDAGDDAGPDASGSDAGVDGGDDGRPAVVIGASDTDWTEIEDAAGFYVFEGHQGLSHFLSALRVRGLSVEPGITAVYSFTPADGGGSLVYPGAETIQIPAAELEPLAGVWLEATAGRTVVLDEPDPMRIDGQTWVVDVVVTDAVGAVVSDRRAVVVESILVN